MPESDGSATDNDHDYDEIETWQLIQSVIDSQRYAFLIGAGTSKPAGIPTAGELIDRWQKECYNVANPDKDLEEWANQMENKNGIPYDERYGFWFETRYPTPGGRRAHIQELVENADPGLSHVILSDMMKENYIPHVLTPNFDDLIEDAHYLYLNSKPAVFHNMSISPRINVIRESQAILKLHGDYFYQDIQNTQSETKQLTPALERTLKQTIKEYGLIVIGYSGSDESIMDPIIDANISAHGIIWCTRNSDELGPKVTELLERENTFISEIEGFEELMQKFWIRVDDVELPDPDKFYQRAESRVGKLSQAISNLSHDENK